MIDSAAGIQNETPLDGRPTFSLSHRLRRAFWALAWTLLAAWTPPPLHRWRGIVLRAFGAKLHPTARVYGSVRIWDPTKLEMGPHSSLGPGVTCYSIATVSIGHHVVVSQGAHLCCGSHDIWSPSFRLIAKPVEIRPNAWICAEAFVGPGTVVGEGAVLAARSVAFDDLEAWKVYRGNPAVQVKDRPRFERSIT